MKDPGMWQRCRAHPMPDGPDGQGFSAWLAEEAGLSQRRADDLILEYKRMAYLAASGVVARPVAPGHIGVVLDLHQQSDDFRHFCDTVLKDHPWQVQRRAGRRDMAAMMAGYEAEFGTAPVARLWAARSRVVPWVLVAALVVGGALAAWVDGSIAPLALAWLPAALLVVYLLKGDKISKPGGSGPSGAARFGGGMGPGG